MLLVHILPQINTIFIHGTKHSRAPGSFNGICRIWNNGVRSCFQHDVRHAACRSLFVCTWFKSIYSRVVSTSCNSEGHWCSASRKPRAVRDAQHVKLQSDSPQLCFWFVSGQADSERRVDLYETFDDWSPVRRDPLESNHQIISNLRC